ncbi:MAG: hypothetical protein NTX03_11785 [Bacteroidetes bacterium]|nr:hypothetical protein [Bacteroidota bacterium]
MKKKKVTSNFGFSLAALIGMCITKHVFMLRDAAEFLARGIDALRIAAFETLTNDVLALPTDTELLEEQKDKNTEKDAAKIVVIAAIQLVMGIVEAKDAKSTSKYKRFGTGDLSKADDNKIIVIAERVVRVGTANLARYAPVLTAPMLTDITTKLNLYRTDLEEAHDATANRDEAAESRVQQQNDLYDELSALCLVGKNIWVSVSEAKYRDYIIYQNPAEQTHFVGYIPAMVLKLIVERSFLPGTQVRLYNPGTTAIKFGLVLNENDEITGGVDVGIGITMDIPIENLGAITHTFLKVKNMDPARGRFEFTVL